MASIAAPGELAFGIQLPIQTLTRTLVDEWEDTATVEDLVAVAKQADRGLDFVGVCDHVAVPDNDYAKHMRTTWYDTVATLSFLAAHTERVRLLSVVYVAAYRHPLLTAKAFGTLDHLSGGRAILGVGAGHVEAEFDALGIDFATRGKLLDETLEAITGAFADTYVSHAGEHFEYHDVGVAPAPPSGELTVWIAGAGKPAFRRVGQFGHGWIPFTNPPDQLPSIIEAINAAAGAAGRGDETFDIGTMPPWMYIGDPPEDIGPHQLSGEPEKIAEVLRDIAGLGANVFHMKFRSRSASECCDQIARFSEEIAPLVTSP